VAVGAVWLFAALTFDYSERSRGRPLCRPASPSARRTSSRKFRSGYRTVAGGVSAPFENMVKRLPVLWLEVGKAPNAEATTREPFSELANMARSTSLER
jgi:hypothetical protein